MIVHTQASKPSKCSAPPVLPTGGVKRLCRPAKGDGDFWLCRVGCSARDPSKRSYDLMRKKYFTTRAKNQFLPVRLNRSEWNSPSRLSNDSCTSMFVEHSLLHICAASIAASLSEKV